jgi:putative endonuclease
VDENRHEYWVYILASQTRGTLYTGVTGRLVERIREHREGELLGFTARHRVTRLVYLELFQYVRDALAREKAIKKWRRAWKIELIEKANPEWRDLWFDINR